jgi:hypothetical protein
MDVLQRTIFKWTLLTPRSLLWPPAAPYAAQFHGAAVDAAILRGSLFTLAGGLQWLGI